MTVEEFKKQFNYAPYDDEELARAAKGVEGEVGKKAAAFIRAREEFDKSLRRIGYERG